MSRYYRKVIRIRAEDSPNVRLALWEKSQGKEPSGDILIPGVISYAEYLKRRSLWDAVKQCVSLDGEFYEGAAILMFPPDWLNLSERRADELRGTRRTPMALGIDPAEGGDDTSFCVVDQHGIIKIESCKTPNTAVVTGKALAWMREFGLAPEQVMFDRGGGGLQHADRLREQGYAVRDVGFGESAFMEPLPYGRAWESRIAESREQYVYRNRRAQLYHMLRLRLDPAANQQVFAIPAEYHELRRQLAPIPLLYDGEGSIYLPPKRKRDSLDKRDTLEDLIGRSPDDADALVLALWAMVDQEELVDLTGGMF